MIRKLMAGLVLASAAPACAQSYEPDRGAAAKEEYGDLLRRATQGAESVRAPSASTPAGAAPAVRTVAPAAPTSKEPSRAEFLHDASEYAGEPHRVRLVDRSKFDSAFVPTDVPNTMRLAPGSIYIDVKARQLYFAKSDAVLRRYGVAVGRQGATWKGEATVGRTARWPDWRPTANIRRENRRLKAVVKGGASNPLGARALYLYQGDRDTLYRIHGTNLPSSIGKFASHGCIRMINEDVIELHSMVRTGAKVFVR